MFYVQKSSVSHYHSFVQSLIYWATVYKTVRPMLSDRYPVMSCPVLSCPVCLSVCSVRALWPNGWTDQDETWLAGRPRPWPHCVRWGSSSPPPKGHSPPIFGPYLFGQMAVWIKMLLGIEVGHGPGNFLLDGDPLSHLLNRFV